MDSFVAIPTINITGENLIRGAVVPKMQLWKAASMPAPVPGFADFDVRRLKWALQRVGEWFTLFIWNRTAVPISRLKISYVLKRKDGVFSWRGRIVLDRSSFHVTDIHPNEKRQISFFQLSRVHKESIDITGVHIELGDRSFEAPPAIATIKYRWWD